MKKRLAGMFLLSFILVFVCAGFAQADFVQSGGNTMYQTASGEYLTGLQKINGEYYYFNSAGVLQKGGWIRTPKGQEYYASESGALLRNQWIVNGKKKFYLKDNGEKAKGLTRIGTALFFFNQDHGKMMTGKLKDKNGNMYVTNKKGVVFSGRFFKQKKARYYANTDGTLAKGLEKIGNDYYFFRLNNGKMITGAKRIVNGYTYFFTKAGKAARETWVKIKGKYYYFLDDGRMATNQKIGNWYVGEDGVRTKTAPVSASSSSSSSESKSGAKKINGKTYLYDSTGKLVTNNWLKINNKTYYANKDGVALTGLQTIGSNRYVFDEDGVLETDTIALVGGTAYVIAADGRVTGTSDASGSAIVAYAKKFLGLPYVWGGTSLTNGADCSGFCYSVCGKFGIRLLRVADDQMRGPSDTYVRQGYTKGIRIRDNSLAPGDLVFYESTGDGIADHVAMYIGNHKVIHEAGKKYGCVITDMDWAHGRVKNRNMRYWA